MRTPKNLQIQIIYYRTIIEVHTVGFICLKIQAKDIFMHYCSLKIANATTTKINKYVLSTFYIINIYVSAFDVYSDYISE